MVKKTANERTFQGELYRIINQILEKNKNIHFTKMTQEENIGIGNARFADGLLYSKIDISKKILFELKNTSWDATDETLVKDASAKANTQGYNYFVTGTPRQLVIYKTFIPGVPLTDRKLKLYSISNIKKDDDVLTPFYEAQITPELIKFLIDLSNLAHDIKEVHWDSIDRFFVGKLSAFILHASASSQQPMYDKINLETTFRKKLKNYLKEQDIFGVTLSFDFEDVYKIAQLSNYLLYLKILFYSYIQRDVPDLNLKPIAIPLDRDLLNKTLRARFDEVLKWDYQNIFQENVLDEFVFEDSFLPELKRHVEEFKSLDFRQLNADIIGAIYNTLIDNREQHDRGQHFTNTNEVDIVNAFCIDKNTQLVIDTGCGAGTFLVRAYYFLKHFNPKLTHEELLERIWGVEIAPFPVFLSTMNLCLLNIKSIDNYPIVLNNDFSEISGKSYYRFNFINKTKSFKIKNSKGKQADVQIPAFDACVGNPPYIRQELIQNKETWNQLAVKEWGMDKINQQSDLYVYYLYHTASFLKNGKRLGYVISGSWLDVSFGAGFQKFLLDNFKIIAIIDHQKKRSFETASVNTVILILEKCTDNTQREQNNVRFVRIYADYEKLIGKTDDEKRAENTLKFVRRIEKESKTITNADYFLFLKNQNELENESTVNGKYSNGHWGANYLRAPEIFKKIVEAGKNKLVPVKSVAEVKYGVKTGANDFFYVTDDTQKALEMSEAEYLMMFGVEKENHQKIWIDKLVPLKSVAEVKRGFTTGGNEFFYVTDNTQKAMELSDEDYLLYFGSNKNSHKNFWKNFGWYYSEMTKNHHIIERHYVKPIFKSQKEAVNLDVDVSRLQNRVIFCTRTPQDLAKMKSKFLAYVKEAESRDFHLRPSNSTRAIWYNISSSAIIGDFIFPSKIGERFRLIDNREAKVFCDKVNYAITIKEKYIDYSEIIFLILNSQLFRYFVDLFSRQMVVKVSDVDVNVVERTLIIRPELLVDRCEELHEIYVSLKSREQGTIFEEIKQKDKIRLDTIILEALGLDADDVAELYRVAAQYVQERKEKSESLTTKKSKLKLSYSDSLRFISERFPEVRKYADLLSGAETRTYKIPDWKAKYPKNSDSASLFENYKVYFENGNQQKQLSFGSVEQITLFRFLNETLDIRNISIEIPISGEDCKTVLQCLKSDFKENLVSIQNLLKSNRSSANFSSIYRDLVLGELLAD